MAEGVYWNHLVTRERSLLTIEIQGKKFTGLMDTGADGSILRHLDWTSSWPTVKQDQRIVGIGEVFRHYKVLGLYSVKGQMGKLATYNS